MWYYWVSKNLWYEEHLFDTILILGVVSFYPHLSNLHSNIFLGEDIIVRLSVWTLRFPSVRMNAEIVCPYERWDLCPSVRLSVWTLRSPVQMNAEISENIRARVLGLSMQIFELPGQHKFISAWCKKGL